VRISHKIIIIIIGALFVIGMSILGMSIQKENNNKSAYKYDVRVSSAGGYTALLDFNNNYFIDKSGKILTAFTSPGGMVSDGWSWGEQATASGIKAPLPYAVKVRWFSIAENQFWEGEAILDQEKLEKLKHYKIKDIFDPKSNFFINNSIFTINYATDGLVTIWLNGVPEEYLITQFQAKKVEEPNWDGFIQNTFGEKINRKDFLAYQMDRKNGNAALNENVRREVIQKKVPGVDYWLRLMKTYSWVLKGNDFFTLKDYQTNYVNGEQYFTHQGQDQTPPRSVPLAFIAFFRNQQTHKDIRADLDLDQEETIEAFEVAAKEPGNEPIQFDIDIHPDMKEIGLFVSKGSHKIELHKFKAIQRDLPAGYNPTIK